MLCPRLILPPTIYRESVWPHVGSDPQISQADHDTTEKALAAHGISWVRICCRLERTRQEDRIKDNIISSNGPFPSLYGLWKDHKHHTDQNAGPPSRPVCEADSSSNFRLSHLLSLILSKISQRDTSENVCMNTEEMMAEIARVNSKGLGETLLLDQLSWRHCTLVWA